MVIQADSKLAKCSLSGFEGSAETVNPEIHIFIKRTAVAQALSSYPAPDEYWHSEVTF